MEVRVKTKHFDNHSRSTTFRRDTHTENHYTLLYGHKHAVAHMQRLCLSRSGTWGTVVHAWSGGQSAGL